MTNECIFVATVSDAKGDVNIFMNDMKDLKAAEVEIMVIESEERYFDYSCLHLSN